MELKLTDRELIQELERRFSANTEALNELKNLTEQLTQLNKRLEESEALKSHFLSNIRNEIINPFASIMALAKNIISLNPEKLEKSKTMAALIHSEAFILDFQLNNIFAAAEVEAGINFPQISNVEILSLTENVVCSFSPLASQKKISISIENKIPVPENGIFFKTDSYKLQLILSNLLSNSISFCQENAIITITIWKNNDTLFVAVKDTGIGIDEDHKKEIFDRFKRLSTRICTPNSGHGLGLSVIREFLDLLNGNINIESEKGIGSTFTFSIPESNAEIDSFSSDGNEEIF